MSRPAKDISSLFTLDDDEAPVGQVGSRAFTGGVQVPQVDPDALVPAAAGSSVAPDATVPSAAPEIGLDFTDSNLNPSSAQGTMGARKGEEPSAGLLGEGDTSTSGQQAGKWGWVSLKGFQKHFDVDTEDVLSRMKSTLAGGFCKGNFSEFTQGNADLYGPFWIATTLIFITAVSSNFQSYFESVRDSKHDDDKGGDKEDDKGDDKGKMKFTSDFNKIPYAACLYYGYVFFLGLVLWATLKCFSSRMKLTQIWCIYGYSLTVFLPVSIILMFPSDNVVVKTLTVLLVAAAVLLSSIFLIRNMREDISTSAPGRSLVIMAIMVAFDVLLGLVLLFYFQKVAAK